MLISHARSSARMGRRRILLRVTPYRKIALASARAIAGVPAIVPDAAESMWRLEGLRPWPRRRADRQNCTHPSPFLSNDIAEDTLSPWGQRSPSCCKRSPLMQQRSLRVFCTYRESPPGEARIPVSLHPLHFQTSVIPRAHFVSAIAAQARREVLLEIWAGFPYISLSRRSGLQRALISSCPSSFPVQSQAPINAIHKAENPPFLQRILSGIFRRGCQSFAFFTLERISGLQPEATGQMGTKNRRF